MTTSHAAELDELLAEGSDHAIERERTEFDRLTAGAPDGLVLFGAGNMGRIVARRLRTVDILPIAFADNNARLWGQSIEGIPVVSPAEAAARYGSSAAFLIAVWAVGSRDRMAARQRQLRELGCRTVIAFPALFWKFPGLFLPHHVVDQPRKVLQEAATVRTAYELWADDASRREYAAQVKWRLRGDFDSMADPVTQNIYFPDDLFSLTNHEVFVDCGAYDGDTVRSFLELTGSNFDRIAAFEPDPANYHKLRQSVAALPPDIAGRIQMHRKATGARDCRVSFSALGTDGSAIGEGDSEVECVALDGALADTAPSHIKMDIEGAELEAIEGARGVIARHSPVLAICSYHRQPDLWRIPALIHSINPGYRLFLRPHLIEGWDLVCYAVPPERTRI
jgi:FkbM family methyltransferase